MAVDLEERFETSQRLEKERFADLESRLEESQRLEKCPRCGDRVLASGMESHGQIHILTDEIGLTNERFPKLAGGTDLVVDGHPHIDRVFGRTQELTLASDVMPQPRRKSVILNAESGTTDDLNGITVRNVVEGFAFLLSPKSTDTISIKHKNAGASSGERISSTSGGSFSIAPGESALIWYDSVSDSTNPWHAVPFSTVSAHAKYTDADAVSAVHAESHTLASHSAKAHGDLSDAPTSAHHTKYTDSEARTAAPSHVGLTFGAELTIATGKITKTDQVHSVDTESDDATDDLASMAGGTDGDIVTLFANNDARTIRILHNDSSEGTVNERFFTLDGGEIIIDTNKQSATFLKISSFWLEISRATVASLTAKGFVELATAAEINTGDATDRAMTPKAFADSNAGVGIIMIPVVAPATETTTGDGKVLIMIPKELDGMDLVDCGCVVFSNGTTGTLDVQIRNITKSYDDVLSTKLKVASGAVVDDGNRVIDVTKDDVSTDDRCTIDFDAVHTTKAKGMTMLLQYRLP